MDCQTKQAKVLDTITYLANESGRSIEQNHFNSPHEHCSARIDESAMDCSQLLADR